MFDHNRHKLAPPQTDHRRPTPIHTAPIYQFLGRVEHSEGRLIAKTAHLAYALAVLVACALSATHCLAADSFHSKLQSELKLSAPDGELREIVESACTVLDIAVFIDPRLNPRAQVETPDESKPLRDLLSHVAAYAGAQVTTLGETVLITPISDADRIATLAAKRQAELLDGPKNSRVLSLLRPYHANSTEHDSTNPNSSPAETPQADVLQAVVAPQELLDDLNKHYRLTCDSAPLAHDLWQARLRGTTAAEALACVLVPMGKSFVWTDNGYAIVPLPQTITVTQAHRILAGRSQEFVLASLASVMGDDFQPSHLDKRTISFAATASQHERFAGLILPTKRTQPRPTAKRYTLAVESKPAGVVLAALQAEGLNFGWDREKLLAGGVNLEQPISIDVNQVTATELLQTIADQVNAKVTTTSNRPEVVLP